MSFERFLLLLRARLGMIAAAVLLTAFVAGMVGILMPPRYFAEASAVLEQPAVDPSLQAAASSSGLNYFLATQRDVVASRNVAARVIENLGLERDLEQTRQRLGGWSPLSALRGLVARLRAGDKAALSQREWLIERLLKDLKVSTGRDSRLLKVGFSSRDPEFSSTVANAFMRAFLEVNVQLKAAPARTESAWLEGQLKQLRDNLAQAESKLSQFQQEKGIVATEEKFDYENLRLSDLSSQLAIAQAEAYSADARRKQLEQFAAGRGRAADVPAEVISSPVVSRLREDVAQREAKMQDMSRQLGPNHPRYQAAQGELQQLRGQLSNEMRSVAQGLATAGSVSGEREASLRGAIDQQKARLLGMKKDREQVAMLARDVDNAQRAYNGAVQRISQARIESASERPSASVVDEASVPSRPAGPGLTFLLAAGALLGAAVGLGAALLLEASQRLVRSADDLVELLGVPLMAVLPPRARRAGPRALVGNVVALPKP